jgi:hypothetical protein
MIVITYGQGPCVLQRQKADMRTWSRWTGEAPAPLSPACSTYLAAWLPPSAPSPSSQQPTASKQPAHSLAQPHSHFPSLSSPISPFLLPHNKLANSRSPFRTSTQLDPAQLTPPYVCPIRISHSIARCSPPRRQSSVSGFAFALIHNLPASNHFKVEILPQPSLILSDILLRHEIRNSFPPKQSQHGIARGIDRRSISSFPLRTSHGYLCVQVGARRIGGLRNRHLRRLVEERKARSDRQCLREERNAT